VNQVSSDKEERPAEYEAHLTGEIFNHQLLWHTVQSLLERGADDEEGSYHTNLAAVLFAYFAFEGFLNFLGEGVAKKQWQDERQFA
jgi:hypothetical protein